MRITIELELDAKRNVVTEFSITEGLYNRTEFITDLDDPESIGTVANVIKEELKWYAE